MMFILFYIPNYRPRYNLPVVKLCFDANEGKLSNSKKSKKKSNYLT